LPKSRNGFMSGFPRLLPEHHWRTESISMGDSPPISIALYSISQYCRFAFCGREVYRVKPFAVSSATKTKTLRSCTPSVRAVITMASSLLTKRSHLTSSACLPVFSCHTSLQDFNINFNPSHIHSQSKYSRCGAGSFTSVHESCGEW
jgi:hypothetical protein